jgi:hypothetical protein
MIKLALALLALLTAACTAEEEESVEERFKRTEAGILNTAESIEAQTENAVRATEAQLENQADAFENSLQATEPADSNAAATNATE